jgi:hypothetical protein
MGTGCSGLASRRATSPLSDPAQSAVGPRPRPDAFVGNQGRVQKKSHADDMRMEAELRSLVDAILPAASSDNELAAKLKVAPPIPVASAYSPEVTRINCTSLPCATSSTAGRRIRSRRVQATLKKRAETALTVSRVSRVGSAQQPTCAAHPSYSNLTTCGMQSCRHGHRRTRSSRSSPRSGSSRRSSCCRSDRRPSHV